jgi:hypothetical protein
MESARTGNIFLIALAALACASLILFFLAAPIERVLTLIPDDASYFFEIADNVSSGEGFTFDRIGETNGYQPLWLYLLIPLYRLVHAAPGTMVRIIALIQILLSATAGLVLYQLLKRTCSALAALIGGAFFIAFVLAPVVNGMESTLLVLLLVLLVSRAVRSGFPDRCSNGESFRIGLLLGLVVLARLDTAFLCISTALLLLLGATGKGAGRRRLAALVMTTLGASLVIVPYLFYNAVRFGSPMPISGILKSSFPAVRIDRNMIFEPGSVGLFGLLLGTMHLALFSARPRGRGGNGLDGAIAALSAAALLHWAHTVLFMRWAVFPWHFASYRVLAALALPRFVDRIPARVPRPVRLAAISLLIAAILAAGIDRYVRRYSIKPRDSWTTASYEAALWARENTRADAIFAMKDAGHFGYFSGRSVVSLDGIVGDTALQEVLRSGRLGAWLEREGVSYLVQHAFWDDPPVNEGTYDTLSVTYASRLYLVESDTLRLAREDEVYRSPPYRDGPYETVFVIWRIGR